MGYRKHDKCVFNVAKDVSTKDAKELHDLYICIGCEVDTNKSGEIYFVNDSIWNGVAETSEGSLCVGCLEARLDASLPVLISRVPIRSTGLTPLNRGGYGDDWGQTNFRKKQPTQKKSKLEKPSRKPRSRRLDGRCGPSGSSISMDNPTCQ